MLDEKQILNGAGTILALLSKEHARTPHGPVVMRVPEFKRARPPVPHSSKRQQERYARQLAAKEPF